MNTHIPLIGKRLPGNSENATPSDERMSHGSNEILGTFL